MAQGSGELRDPSENGEALLLTTSSTAKAQCYQTELGEAEQRPNKGVVHPVKDQGSSLPKMGLQKVFTDSRRH